MPKATTENLTAYKFGVQKTRVPETGADGIPLHDGQGNPKMIDLTTLVFTDPTTNHTLVIPLDENARDEMIRQLTGGIVVPVGNGGMSS